MKKTACIYTSNTGVGLISDVDLLQDLLFEYYDIDVVYFNHKFNTTTKLDKYDVGIFIQCYSEEHSVLNKKNIFIPNEEWLDVNILSQLHKVDTVVCKSTFARELLTPYNNNVVSTGFISLDKNNNQVERKNNFLHLGGKSWQKGTESVLSSFNKNKLPLTFIHSNKNFEDLHKEKNINYISDFLDSSKLDNIINENVIHICPSIYEGWGHYMYEALSVGALTYVTKLPMIIEFLDPDLVVFLDCKFQQLDTKSKFLFLNSDRSNNTHQFGWVVDQNCLDNNILEYKKHLETHKPDKVRAFFKHLNEENSKKLLNVFLNI